MGLLAYCVMQYKSSIIGRFRPYGDHQVRYDFAYQNL
uniref:Uncharacterized protein n=1 Tax=Arundo donax TaxID=35708 RepID=A0A0A9BVR4_ARUDO